MPIPQRSRYHRHEIIEAQAPGGEVRPTVAIRRSDSVEHSDAPYHHLVTGAEALDYLSSRYLGTSEFWWRIADANPLRFPTDLISGESLEVPDTLSSGRVVRSRKF